MTTVASRKSAQQNDVPHAKAQSRKDGKSNDSKKGENNIEPAAT